MELDAPQIEAGQVKAVEGLAGKVECLPFFEAGDLCARLISACVKAGDLRSTWLIMSWANAAGVASNESVALTKITKAA